jgi:hypothetical protein
MGINRGEGGHIEAKESLLGDQGNPTRSADSKYGNRVRFPQGATGSLQFSSLESTQRVLQRLH